MEYIYEKIIINEELNPPEGINYNIFNLFITFYHKVNY